MVKQTRATLRLTLNTSSRPVFPRIVRQLATRARGFLVRRIEGDTAHFITLSFWESLDVIVAFAGHNPEVAKYYPEDQKYLLELEPTVTHYELFQ